MGVVDLPFNENIFFFPPLGVVLFGLILAKRNITNNFDCIPVSSFQVNFLANVTVFCASVGLHVDATVTAVKHQRIVCRYGDTFSIYIIVPLQGEDAEPLPNDPESGDPLSIFPRDLVQVEIARVTYSPAGGSIFLSGRILSVLKRGNLAKKVLGLPFDNEEGEEAAVSEVKPKKSRKRDFSHLESQDEMTPAKKKKKSKSKKLEEHHEEKNEEEVDGLDESGQLQETPQRVKLERVASSEKPVRRSKSKKHEVVEDEVRQDLGTEVGLEQLQEASALSSPDLTTTSKKRKSKKHSVVEEAEEMLPQETETDVASGRVQEIPGVADPDPIAVSRKKSSKRSSLIEESGVYQPISLKPDPDSVLVQPVNTRRTSKKAKHQEAAPVVEAEGEEEVEKGTETPVPRRCLRNSGLLKQDQTELYSQHWHPVPKVEQSPDISMSSAEEESDAEAGTTVVTRS